MRKISDAVAAIIEADPALRSGLAQRLMNLSQVARHIRPAVEARTQKPVRSGAISMALSRLQNRLPNPNIGPSIQLADRVTVQRGLAVLTLSNTRRAQEALPRLQERIRESHGYLTITEGIREMTVIVQEELLPQVWECLVERPDREELGVASLSVSLTDQHLATPGVLYRILQAMALQGVNLAEIASTTTEFHIYIAEADVMLALDSLYATFGRK